MSLNSPSNYQLRPIAEWDEEYVKQLPTDEFDWLDFKTSPWLNVAGGGCLEELSKYVSAYANFDGGYLIVGVHDPRKRGAIVIDGGVRADLVRGGIDSWLEDKIPNLADAALNRLEVRALHAKESESAITPGCCLIIIHVPASESAPHQATNHKYYTRLSSKLSSLGHRAVMDILGRRKHPKLEILDLKLTWTERDAFILTAAVENTSNVLARFCCLIVELPVTLGRDVLLTYKNAHATTDDGVTVVRVVLRNDSSTPLFPLSKMFFREELEGSPRMAQRFHTLSEVRLKAFADEMPCVEQRLPIDKVVVRHFSDASNPK
jgi:schlafen family protein